MPPRRTDSTGSTRVGSARPIKLRSPGRSEAIMDATYALLAEVGYDRLTIDAVAARAHASKTTIYRRWPDKRTLVIAALERQEASHPSLGSDTGTLRGDLRSLLALIAALATEEDSSTFTSLLYASQHDPVLAHVVREQLVDRRRNECRMVLERAAERGELQADVTEQDVDATLELLLGQVIARKVLRGLPLDDTYLDNLVDGVLLPVLAGKVKRPRHLSPRERRRHSSYQG